MTSNSSNNVLALCSGPIITTWDCHNQPSENSIEELKANGSMFQFEPFENHHNITDFTWNHNGNGTYVVTFTTKLSFAMFTHRHIL